MKSITKLGEAINTVVDNILKNVNTCIVGSIVSFNPDQQLAEVRIGIDRVLRDGSRSMYEPIIRVPVLFLGGNHCIEFEINAGDEGLILFSQRCIDAWVESGDKSTNPILRKHDITDALFVAGFRSQVNRRTNFSNDGIRITDQSGTNGVHLKNNGDVVITAVNVSIESATLTHNGTNIGDSHTHPYNWTDPAGSSNTSPPN